MSRSYKVLGFLLVTMLALYGCAKAPMEAANTDTPATTAKMKKLEEDYRNAVAGREQLRQKLTVAEDHCTKAQKQLEETKAAAATEKEALKNEVRARTTERDTVNAQYETFRKNLKELLGSADNSIGSLNLPAPQPSPDRGARK
jgi:F0F1-type ATP synthase membrane subunit b/b'